MCQIKVLSICPIWPGTDLACLWPKKMTCTSLLYTYDPPPTLVMTGSWFISRPTLTLLISHMWTNTSLGAVSLKLRSSFFSTRFTMQEPFCLQYALVIQCSGRIYCAFTWESYTKHLCSMKDHFNLILHENTKATIDRSYDIFALLKEISYELKIVKPKYQARVTAEIANATYVVLAVCYFVWELISMLLRGLQHYFSLEQCSWQQNLLSRRQTVKTFYISSTQWKT